MGGDRMFRPDSRAAVANLVVAVVAAYSSFADKRRVLKRDPNPELRLPGLALAGRLSKQPVRHIGDRQ